MHKKKTSICLISPSLQMGGLERVMCNLANYFCSEGYTVYYIVLYKFKKFYELNEGIVYIEPKEKYIGSKLRYHVGLLRYIRTTVKACMPDTVLSFGDYHNAMVILALQGLNIPIYLSDRSSPSIHFGTFMRVFRKWAYRKSTGIIAQTERAANQKRQMLGHNFNITVIPNVIREISAYPVKREKYILGVGRHDRVKGFDRLINAYALICTDWKLVLAGGGANETDNLRRQVKELKIEDNVIFLGKVTDIDRIYAKAGIFCLPSRSEGFPNALCEAMASGLPCVSFDIVAGPSDLIENNKNGILVKDGDIQAMADQLFLLINDATLREKLGNEASKIKEDLALQVCGREFLRVITSQLYNVGGPVIVG